MENKWKLKRYHLINNGCNEPREWEIIGQQAIHNVTYGNAYDVNKMDLKLVFLFKYRWKISLSKHYMLILVLKLLHFSTLPHPYMTSCTMIFLLE